VVNAFSIGEIGRVVDNSLAYITLDGDDKTLCFSPNVLDRYQGQSFAEYGITTGAKVSVEWNSDAEVVNRVAIGSQALADADSRRSAFGSKEHPKNDKKASSERQEEMPAQIELHPAQEPRGTANIFSALPKETRAFGKIVNTADLLPGDLMLAREIEPDNISRMIANTQEGGGYHQQDTRWTHAAMYLGDGANVVEATFDSILKGGSVRVTNLFKYSQGAHALRFRRSHYVADDRQRWRLCIRAMTRLGKPYDFKEAAAIFIKVVLRGDGFFSDEMRRFVDGAVICSLLYSDAYGEAIRRVLGEREGVCVPAWLSGSDEFEDVKTNWASIGR
jgi:hypothetical protein